MAAQYRQGDVLLMQVSELPVEAKEEEPSDKIVLAYGEVTGHSHSVRKEDAKLFRNNEDSYLVVETKANLVHEEHDSIPLPAGVYKVIRQREYNPRTVTNYVSD
ncbi:MAG: hypothetical protein U0103_14705 [Candidatus Obscuribacterales bacterium]|nr:hypothetical protein [Cyanobacteria bacterium SZAS LIN-5]